MQLQERLSRPAAALTLLLMPMAAAWGQAPEAVSLEYIAHACFRLEADGTSLVIDPYADRVWLGYDFPHGIDADIVLSTHPHYDHDGGDRRGHPSPWPEGVPTIRDPGEAEAGPFKVIGVAGKHADPYGREFEQKNTLYVIEVAGLRIAHLGDNGPLTQANIAALGSVDVLMLPADGEEHILKNGEVAAILAALEPRIVVPMHYRHPDLEPGDGPSDLGPIDPWLAGRNDVVRLGSHRAQLSRGTLPAEPQVWVFEHSSVVKRPR